MPTDLEGKAVEESTYAVVASFFDEETPPQPVTPNAGLSWTLTDEHGNIINNRNAVSISPATSVTIVLSGDDLALDSTSEIRVVTVAGTYDSSLGSGLPIKDEARFKVVSLAAYPDN
jgi:hypothetical protein